MIVEFCVSNFFSIRSEQKISFEASSDSQLEDEYVVEIKPGVRLLKLGIVYGANASGKSNMLRALDFFRQIMTEIPADKTTEIGAVPFLLDEESRNAHTRMSMTFYLEDERYVLSVDLDKQRIYQESLAVYASKTPTTLYKRSYNAQSDMAEVSFSQKSGIAKKSQNIIVGNTINNSTVIAAFGKSNVESSRLNRVYDYFSNRYSEMVTPAVSLTELVKAAMRSDENLEQKRFLLKMLRVSDFNIVDIRLHELGNASAEIDFQHKTDAGQYELPEALESNGTMRFLGMSVLLHRLLVGNCFLQIDEAETSLHYELLSYFVKLFLANSDDHSQMLFTTHDINLLNEEFLRRDAIWFTDKNDLGETTLKRLNQMGLHKTLSPYNAYRQGKLVRLPFLGSIYLDQND